MNRDNDNDPHTLKRREFMGAALGAAAGIGASSLASSTAQAQPPTARGGDSSPFGGGLFRAEVSVRNCEVEGKVPDDLNGAFYRVGPDPQYALRPGNIPFDGEGHVSTFRIKNGRVDYLTRYAKTERYLAQDKAGKLLFPMYRNPYLDDPAAKGLSRSTANTHIINHKNMILALKEDSPPAALDLLTLETVDPVYTFGDQLPSQTFTAHPKVDSENGNIVAFGYEATGFGSKDVSMFEIDKKGNVVWHASIKVPYVGMLHDFAVTENHIVFYVIPLAFDEKQMRNGGIHWSWDSSLKTYFGIVRRHGDGKDVRWIEGPTRSSTHVMGAFEDKGRIYVDVEMSQANPFPFMPQKDGSPWNPATGASHITRLSADLKGHSVKGYSIEQMYPHRGALPRQDDRYNTMPYRYGFLGCPDPYASNPREAGACYARFDHRTRKATQYNAGTQTRLDECCFAPKHAKAKEAEGYLLGVAHRRDEGGRSDLLILDAEHLKEGPLAVVKLPVKAVGQIHGLWVPEAQIPQA